MTTIKSAFSNGFRNAFKINSRTSRKEHWIFVLLAFLIYFFGNIVIVFISYFIGKMTTSVLGSISTFLMVAMTIYLLIAYLTSVVRRFHDVGKSAWFYFVPFYNLYLLVQPSQTEDNKWGPKLN